MQKTIKGKNFRLIIPSLKQFGENPDLNSPEIINLKKQILTKLLEKESKRGLTQWCIATEIHPVSRYLHLDILLIYSKRVQNPYTRYDYLIKHGYITRYRTLNKAIIQYGTKEDSHPLSNIEANSLLLADKASTKEGLYEILQKAMLKNPFEFNSHQYLHEHNLHKNIIKTSWPNVLSALKKKQQIVCNNLLKDKPGIKLITQQLIKEKLSEKELKEYYSWEGYQVIINHINQISKYGYKRPHKTKNLFVCGRPNTGKTRLALQIQKYTAVYYKDVSNWFPSYLPDVYRMILWNEFSLKGLKYPKILNLLEGTKLDLEYKGGSVLKTDNQLIYMTSNMTLNQHIISRFKSLDSRKLSKANLKARVTQVRIPKNKDLFLLLKLIEEENK